MREELREHIKRTQQTNMTPEMRGFLDQVEAAWRDYLEWAELDPRSEDVLYASLITLMTVSTTADLTGMPEDSVIPVLGAAISNMYARSEGNS